VSRLRVLVVPKWYPWPDRPVFGAFCREHARALATRHDVVVLASLATSRPDFAIFRLEDAVEDGIRTLRVRYRRPFLRPFAMACQLFGMLAAWRRLRREGWRADVVHAHVFEAGPPALALGRLSRVPVVITEHYTGFRRGLVRGYNRLLARWSFEHADLVAPVSEELAGHLRELAPRARLEVVPNVVDTTVFAPADGTPEQSARPTRLLNVADLAEKKGQSVLVRAVAELPDATLEIVGAGPEREPLERLIRELDIEDRARLVGTRSREQVADLMRDADLFVLSSFHENLPVVLIEAQASGLPAVATAVGGVPELIDAKAGLLVPPGDPVALAAAIRTAIGERYDPAVLHQRAEERYGYAAICARWTALYETLGVGSPRD
jgi:glycosyltransferase involved in cell wall biosynthesis